MRLSNIHRLGMFHQKLRSAANVHEELTALREYKKHMDEIEADAFESYKETEAFKRGNTSRDRESVGA